ncbi:MAG: IS110 family transposase [Sulfuricella denitrificans]|nr:IS110 family transposase [Sulfuricella denitrificans]
MARYLGIDLHRNCFTVCIRTKTRKMETRNWPIDALNQFGKTLKKSDQVAVESTGNTRLFYEAIQPRVKRVVIVNPSQFKVISQSVKKTDKNDAETLALFLAKDHPLPEVRMKDPAQAQMASITQTRDKLVKLRTTLKNKINNILSARGINLKREELSSEKGLNKVLSFSWDVLVQTELQVLVDQIRSLNESIKKLEITIHEEGPKQDGHKNLTSIKGIGKTSASILLSVIGDVNDFEDEGKLASYLGLVPRVSNSNETERSGRITKQGNKLARTTLVQCSLIAVRYSPYLRRFYECKKAERGTGKAIIALARRFLRVIYNTLKNDWVFEDFPNFVLVKTRGTKACGLRRV